MSDQSTMLDLKDEKDGVSFHVSVLPKSSKNMIAGILDGALKIKLTAPPVDNAANKLCVTFLSKCLKIPKSSIEILSGHTSRKKNLLIRCKRNDGPDSQAEIRKRLIALADEK